MSVGKSIAEIYDQLHSKINGRAAPFGVSVRPDAGILLLRSGCGAQPRDSAEEARLSALRSAPTVEGDRGGRPAPAGNPAGFRRVNVNLPGHLQGARPNKDHPIKSMTDRLIEGQRIG